MRTPLTATLILFGFLCGVPLWPDNSARPDWLLLEQGNAYFARKEFGQALQLYKEAIVEAGAFPEAEMAIGDIYVEEGEYELARMQYEKAYNQRNAFNVPLQKYDVLYRLARLHENKENYRTMEDVLQLIVAGDKRFTDSSNSRLKVQIEKNYFEKGLDQVLRLYRFETSFANAAHSKLGWFYYRTGRFSKSVTHYLYAIIYRMSEISAFQHEQDVDFEFVTLGDSLKEAERNKDLSQYIADIDLFKDLYYLAGATYSLGYPQHSVMLWKLISGSKNGGKFIELARRQIKKPWIEPFIVAATKTKIKH